MSESDRTIFLICTHHRGRFTWETLYLEDALGELLDDALDIVCLCFTWRRLTWRRFTWEML